MIIVGSLYFLLSFIYYFYARKELNRIGRLFLVRHVHKSSLKGVVIKYGKN